MGNIFSGDYLMDELGDNQIDRGTGEGISACDINRFAICYFFGKSSASSTVATHNALSAPP